MNLQHDFQPSRREAGFSLLEVIVALGILSVGIAAAVSLFTAGTAAHSRAVDRLKSIEISESIFAAVEGALRDGADLDDIRSGDVITEILSRWPGVTVDLSFSTVPKPEFVDAVVVRMRIKRTSRGQQVEESFEQIIARSRSVRLIPE